MQYSIFRGRVTANDKMLILNEIEKTVGGGDKVHVIDLCEACWKNLETIGFAEEPERAGCDSSHMAKQNPITIRTCLASPHNHPSHPSSGSI